MRSLRIRNTLCLLFLLSRCIQVDPNRRTCYFCGGYNIDPDDFPCEEVDRLTRRHSMDNVACVQYLMVHDDGRIEAWRWWTGYDKNYWGTSTSIYCYDCDSDLCNNANIWRPMERWFYTYDGLTGGGKTIRPWWISLLLSVLCAVLVARAG
ncbi:hypothetical protein M8J75_003875 [Diaphorina citri]|nr:hypothetical protein M8J75_003875 [Diaphorina citri]